MLPKFLGRTPSSKLLGRTPSSKLLGRTPSSKCRIRPSTVSYTYANQDLEKKLKDADSQMVDPVKQIQSSSAELQEFKDAAMIIADMVDPVVGESKEQRTLLQHSQGDPQKFTAYVMETTKSYVVTTLASSCLGMAGPTCSCWLGDCPPTALMSSSRSLSRRLGLWLTKLKMILSSGSRSSFSGQFVMDHMPLDFSLNGICFDVYKLIKLLLIHFILHPNNPSLAKKDNISCFPHCIRHIKNL
jgi:hypothetical protein